ncbi:jg3448 [Pararge aegeria aegeria]|uniref:Jg3448 protein n=1 Tax=Pararge aegeria aegeria TaxID=348720 RepID=A0A8S4R6L7_9NEOP|nr:jg3448 [Pararge aegeria aegeria]
MAVRRGGGTGRVRARRGAARGRGRYVSAVAGSSGRRREECGRPSDAERPSPYASRILRPRIPTDDVASTFRHLATTFDTRTLLCMTVMNGILRNPERASDVDMYLLSYP